MGRRKKTCFVDEELMIAHNTFAKHRWTHGRGRDFDTSCYCKGCGCFGERAYGKDGVRVVNLAAPLKDTFIVFDIYRHKVDSQHMGSYIQEVVDKGWAKRFIKYIESHRELPGFHGTEEFIQELITEVKGYEKFSEEYDAKADIV